MDQAGNRWDGSKLTITSQVASGVDFAVEGFFQWQSSSIPAFGTELVRGTMFADRRLQLTGYQLQNSSGIVLANYEARIARDGERIENGVWSGGIPGEWSAQRVQATAVELGEPLTTTRAWVFVLGADGTVEIRRAYLARQW